MLKILNIFDVSTFIYAGHVNKHSKLEKLVDTGSTWKTHVTPTGGTSFIFRALYDIANSGDCVFCCDRNPTIKKDLSPYYKATRPHRRDVMIDKAVAEYFLTECGCTVLAKAGYEADDIVYSLVKKFHDQYDEIRIYTSDSDLFFLVDDKVTIYPSNSNGKLVTRANYENTKVHGVEYVYNCITAAKIVKGDASDNIAALDRKDQDRFLDIFYQPNTKPLLGNKDWVMSMAAIACPDLIPQIQLVFPLDVDDLPDEFPEPDYRMIANFGDAMGTSFFRGRGAKGFDITPYIEEIQSNGWYLESEDLS